jgi:hypothetical protein
MLIRSAERFFTPASRRIDSRAIRRASDWSYVAPHVEAEPEAVAIPAPRETGLAAEDALSPP